jgi:integrase
VTDWTLHDLRRTFATIHARIGTPIHVTERLLNHISGTQAGIVSVYQRHTYLPEMRKAMEAYEDELLRIVAPPAAKEAAWAA